MANTTMNSSAKWIAHSLTNDGEQSTEITNNTANLTTGVQLAAFDVINTSSSAIAIAFKLTTSGGAALYVGADANETTQLDTTTTPNYNVDGEAGEGALNGWFVIDSVSASGTANLVQALNTVFSAEKINGLTDNSTVTVTLQITAVPAGANSDATLAQAISAGEFASISPSEVQAQS